MRLLLSIGGLILCSVVCAQNVPGRVGYVDVERVVAQLPETKQMEQKLVEVRAKLAQELQDKQQNFQRVYSFYTSNSKNLVDSTRTKLENQLQLLQQELQQFEGEAQSTFDNTQRLYMAPVYLKIGNVIAQVASEKGYSLIIPVKIDGNYFVLFSDKKLDVSDLVLTKYTSAK